jgi:hypothetical protein
MDDKTLRIKLKIEHYQKKKIPTGVFGNVGRSCSTRCNCCVTVVKDLMISYTKNEIARALYSYVLGVLSMVLVQ